MVSLQFAGVFIAVVACGVGTWTDIRNGIIPNWITLPSMMIGLGIGWASNGIMGLGLSVLSALATAMVPLILFRYNAMGGGDVKLFAAIGALMGFDLSLQVLMASFCVGAIFGIGIWIVKGELGAHLKLVGRKLMPLRRRTSGRTELSVTHTCIRFAPAMLTGCILTVAVNARELVQHVW
ncbi:MAG: prepilin peptidase [Deltaproteobacteria bacterium]|nr:prepilin peptidase [Deltaproteobacteria bacterium]